MAAKTSFGTRVLRLARIALHLARGVATAGLMFPFLDASRRAKRVRSWSTRLLHILAIRLEVAGTPPPDRAAPALIVANHVSWLDICAIAAVHGARFVAKSEVRGWPVIGWLAARAGTLFIERARKHHAVQINEQVAAALRQGETIAVFPEGTTSAGDILLPFHASLLQPALTCGAPLYPVAIRYERTDGSHCKKAGFEGDKSFVDSLLLMVTQSTIHARLQFLAPLDGAREHRRELAHAATQCIADALGVTVLTRERILPGPNAHAAEDGLSRSGQAVPRVA